MNNIQCFSPKTLQEYHKIYSEIEDSNIIIFSGGTDVMIGRYDLPQNAVILDISGISELKGIDKKETRSSLDHAQP